MHMHTIYKSNLVYKSQWLQVYEDLIGYNDSNHLPEIFNRINVDDTVIILPIFENGLLLMVEGYRHGASEDLLEFPGGFMIKMKNHHRQQEENCLKKPNILAIVLNL
jgi:hypothetical protein